MRFLLSFPSHCSHCLLLQETTSAAAPDTPNLRRLIATFSCSLLRSGDNSALARIGAHILMTLGYFAFLPSSFPSVDILAMRNLNTHQYEYEKEAAVFLLINSDSSSSVMVNGQVEFRCWRPHPAVMIGAAWFCLRRRSFIVH